MASLHRKWLGAELRLALRETAHHLRRCVAARADDGRLVAIRAIADEQTDERHAHGPHHHSAMELRARRPAARDTAQQIALALRDEVRDLEAAGLAVIQIDEPALREGLPLRRADWPDYLGWAVDAFRLASAVVRDDTQIHTHMCYCEFNDIIDSIAALDADVISIETSRSNMELLDAFVDFRYPRNRPRRMGHPFAPSSRSAEMLQLIDAAMRVLPKERLWMNPDCGLKTRKWEEVKAALTNLFRLHARPGLSNNLNST